MKQYSSNIKCVQFSKASHFNRRFSSFTRISDLTVSIDERAAQLKKSPNSQMQDRGMLKDSKKNCFNC